MTSKVIATPPHIDLLENSGFEGKFKATIESYWPYPGGQRDVLHIPYWWENNNQYQNYGCYLFIENEVSEIAPEYRKVVYDTLTTAKSGNVSFKFLEWQELDGNVLKEYLTYRRTPHSIPFYTTNDNINKNSIYINQWDLSPITISFYAKTNRPGAKIKLNAIFHWYHPYEASEIVLEQPVPDPADSRRVLAFWDYQDYAFVADGASGLQILDLSDKNNPDVVGNVPMDRPALDVTYSTSIINDQERVDYAYVVDDEKLRIFNVLYKDNPEEIISGRWTDPDGSPQSVCFKKDIQGDFVYIADGYGLQIINVTNKSSTNRTNSFHTTGYAKDIAVSGNYAYLACSSNGLEIVDIRNKQILVSRGNCTSITSANAVVDQGIYCYVADGDQGLCIIDTSDKDNPFVISTINALPLEEATEIDIRENDVYVTYRNYGVVIYNVSDKENPEVVKILETPVYANGVNAFLDYAYVADGDCGVRIIDISGILSLYPSQTITVNNTEYLTNPYAATIPTSTLKHPVKEMEIRIGYVYHNPVVLGNAVWIDDISLYDNLDWQTAPQGAPTIEITKDGFIKVGGSFYQPRFLWDETGGCFGYNPSEFFQAVASRHFNGFYAPHSGVVIYGYRTKRELQMVLDYAYYSGLKVLAHVPVYPVNGGNKFPLGEFYVKEWAEFFSNHPALFGWFIYDEIGPATLNSTARDIQVSKWIHDAEGSNFHPTVANTSEFPIIGEFYSPPPPEPPSYWRFPWEEQSDYNSNTGCLIDFFWEDDQSHHYTDIISPNVYPIRAYNDTPENTITNVMQFCYSAQKRHHLMWTSLDGTENFRKTALIPFIQIAPHVSCRTPQYGEIRAMTAQTLSNHGNGMIFWSDCRADCGTHEYQGTDYYWNLLDENARAAWGAQGMWAALPDINDGLQWMFSKLVLNRLEQENVAKKIVYLSSMGEKVDDTVIWGLDPNTNYGIWDRILCGEPDHRGNSPEMSRSLIRFKALNTIPEILGKDILGVRLRLFNWFGFQYTTPEVGREGPQRVLVSRLPDNDPNNLEWIEGTGGQTGITWNNSAAYFNYQTERRLPFENNLGCFTNPVLNETLFECRVQYIYRECLVSPSLIETWRDYPNKNEGFYLEPFFETGSDEYECAFTASEGTSNRYAPHLELYYLPQGQGNDHKPFRYIAVYNYDFIESSVFLDNDGSNYALLAIINNSGLPQCVLIYSPDAPTSGEVTEYNPNGTYIRVFDLQPAYQYHVNGGLQHVCDQGVKDWENTYDDWALIEPNVDLEGYEIRILKIPWR